MNNAPAEIDVTINGEPHRLPAGFTIADWVATTPFPPSTLLIEHNQIALHRGEWVERRLEANDQLEILRIAAGG